MKNSRTCFALEKIYQEDANNEILKKEVYDYYNKNLKLPKEEKIELSEKEIQDMIIAARSEQYGNKEIIFPQNVHSFFDNQLHSDIKNFIIQKYK